MLASMSSSCRTSAQLIVNQRFQVRLHLPGCTPVVDQLFASRAGSGKHDSPLAHHSQDQKRRVNPAETAAAAMRRALLECDSIPQSLFKILVIKTMLQSAGA
jgi:hypothetical protein